MTSQHFIIVGAGIVGASLAFALTRLGQRVTVIERHAPAAGASSKSFAWLNANYPDTAAYFQLRIEALEHYRKLHHAFDLSEVLRFGGSLWWEDEGEDFDSHVALLESFDYRCSVVDAKRFAALAPRVQAPPERALHAPEEAGVALADLTRWMLDFAAGEGAAIQLGSGVDGLMIDGGRCVGVRTALGEHRADQVCLAAGVLTRDLLQEVGFDLPMQNAAGLILASQPQPPVLDQVIMSPDVHFRQDPDGTIRMGEIFSGAFEAGRDVPALAQTVIERVKARLNTPEPLRLAHSLVGTRPVPADGFPAVGGIAGITGLSVAVMHSAATLGPLIGELLASELVDGGALSGLLTAFRPDRFAAP